MSAKFELKKEVLFVSGIWDKDSTSGLKLGDFTSYDLNRNLILDFKDLEFIDTAGVRFFLALEHDLSSKGVQIQKLNLSSKVQGLFELCQKNYQRVPEIKRTKKDLKEYFIELGILTCTLFSILKAFISFVGAFFVSLVSCIKKPKNFRFISFLYHIENSSLKALPIVALTSLLVGIVLAYQAAYQLAQFGANIFIVDLVGVSATRELAPLISAIVIAGRSASSYTAQIGVMKITDEIAAMNTMGFRSFEFIVLPRVLALIVAMPLIVAVSDFISIFGGMVIASVNLDISFGEFLKRFREAVELKHVVIGLIKAPVFGFLIGIIACFRGFEVKNTTSSIGIYTTKSVVNAIFWVIAFDAIFSIVLTQMDI